ncbi:MAG: hypothetical protein BWY66_02503 [bacterium ADurb.Bin374]|nr:MAG: hypothetical protein BWY66_02503 [bacterium ADurb.Bin374]
MVLGGGSPDLLLDEQREEVAGDFAGPGEGPFRALMVVAQFVPEAPGAFDVLFRVRQPVELHQLVRNRDVAHDRIPAMEPSVRDLAIRHDALGAPIERAGSEIDIPAEHLVPELHERLRIIERPDLCGRHGENDAFALELGPGGRGVAQALPFSGTGFPENIERRLDDASGHADRRMTRVNTVRGAGHVEVEKPTVRVRDPVEPG